MWSTGAIVWSRSGRQDVAADGVSTWPVAVCHHIIDDRDWSRRRSVAGGEVATVPHGDAEDVKELRTFKVSDNAHFFVFRRNISWHTDVLSVPGVVVPIGGCEVSVADAISGVERSRSRSAACKARPRSTL